MVLTARSAGAASKPAAVPTPVPERGVESVAGLVPAPACAPPGARKPRAKGSQVQTLSSRRRSSVERNRPSRRRSLRWAPMFPAARAGHASLDGAGLRLSLERGGPQWRNLVHGRS
jgi:hypothetical protein